MRYMLLVIPTVYTTGDPELPPSDEMVEAMMTYTSEMAEARILETVDALQPPRTGARVLFHEAGSEVVDVDPDGALGGFWIVNVDSLEDALEWARRCPLLPGDALEVRPMEIYEQ